MKEVSGLLAHLESAEIVGLKGGFLLSVEYSRGQRSFVVTPDSVGLEVDVALGQAVWMEG